MKIAVYAVALNEAKHVARWLSCTSDADWRVICDTGSTDGGLSMVNEDYQRVQVTDVSVKPWRFDDARNAALALVPPDIDVCIALDMDEELAPGWREAIEAGWSAEATRMTCGFALSHDADGKPTRMMSFHRIHARHAYRWQYPIHEALMPKRGVTEHTVHVDQLLVHHKPDDKKSRASYLSMLAGAVDEYPGDARMAFYYARELMFTGAWGMAIEEFKRYLRLDTYWAEQRSEAMRYLGRCFREMRKPGDRDWFTRACLEAPRSRLAWVELAENARLHEDWLGACWAVENALQCDPAPTGQTYDVYTMTVKPYAIGSICAFYCGLKDMGRAWALKACELDPGNIQYRRNLEFY